MSEINFKCIGCNEELIAPKVLHGASIRCDNCETKQDVPFEFNEADEVSFRCISCDLEIAVPKSFIGKKIRCECDAKIIVPEPGGRAVLAPQIK